MDKYLVVHAENYVILGRAASLADAKDLAAIELKKMSYDSDPEVIIYKQEGYMQLGTPPVAYVSTNEEADGFQG